MHAGRWVRAGMSMSLCIACSETHDPQLPNVGATDGAVQVASAAGDDASTPGSGGSTDAASVGDVGSGAGAGGDAAARSGDAAATGSDAATTQESGSAPGSEMPGETLAGTAGGIAGGASPYPPPGCRDSGGPSRLAWIVDDRTFVLSDAKQACGAPASAAKGQEGDCAFPMHYATYRVPSLWFPGTYQVGRDASIVVERRFPISINDQAGCQCLPSIETPEPLTSGSIKIESFDGRELKVEIRSDDVGVEIRSIRYCSSR